MKTMQWLFLSAAFAALLITATVNVQAYPEPSVVQHSWQLNYTHSQPRVVSVKSLEGTIEWYWYFTYKVVNKTGREQAFVPEITIATDKGDVLSAGSKVPPSVFDDIMKKEGNELLEHPEEVTGKLLQGEDFAKESVAIWPAFTHDVDKVTIFVGGLSGETAVITDPKTKEEVVLRKTYQVDYITPGTDVHPQKQGIKQLKNKWIMR